MMNELRLKILRNGKRTGLLKKMTEFWTHFTEDSNDC